MLGKVALFVTGFAIGVVGDRVSLELRKPPRDQFPALRRRVNDRVNPWLLEHGYPGSANAEIGVLEHVGRTTGKVRLTPVHPTLREDVVLIPAPLGEGSQWARNVLSAGSARLPGARAAARPRPARARHGSPSPGCTRPAWRRRSIGSAGGTCGSTWSRGCRARSRWTGCPRSRRATARRRWNPGFAMDAEPTTLEPLGAG